MAFTDIMPIVTGIFLGIGLSAAAGFRVFLPFLCLSVSSYFHIWNVPAGMQWTGTLPALLLFGTATVFELAAYYIPWIDNLMDTISTPAAAIAGSILTASALTDVSPMLQWSAGIIAGGSTAAVFSSSTALTRAASSLTTGGIANPLLATTEIGGSLLFTFAALFAPIFAGITVMILFVFTARFIYKRLINKRKDDTDAPLLDYNNQP